MQISCVHMNDRGTLQSEDPSPSKTPVVAYRLVITLIRGASQGEYACWRVLQRILQDLLDCLLARPFRWARSSRSNYEY